jgi:hypothetical protein
MLSNLNTATSTQQPVAAKAEPLLQRQNPCCKGRTLSATVSPLAEIAAAGEF